MTDTPGTPTNAPPKPVPARLPDGSGTERDADQEQLDELFAALRRLTP
jgi:hypothetical protein